MTLVIRQIRVSVLLLSKGVVHCRDSEVHVRCGPGERRPSFGTLINGWLPPHLSVGGTVLRRPPAYFRPVYFNMPVHTSRPHRTTGIASEATINLRSRHQSFRNSRIGPG